MPTLDRDGDVHLLDLGDDENRFNPPWLAAVGALLDEVEAAPGPKALVTRATGKFWSNGLDLAWLGDNADQAGPFVDSVHALFARVLALPVPTVAACQGHHQRPQVRACSCTDIIWLFMVAGAVKLMFGNLLGA